MTVNKAILVGFLGQDPDIRTMQSGDAVANLSVATSESWRDKNTGERKTATEWHRVSVFGQSADFIGQHASKGSKVYVEGKLQTRKWTDKDGNERQTTEIAVRWPSGSIQLLDTRQPNSSREPLQEPQKMPALEDDLYDEIPF